MRVQRPTCNTPAILRDLIAKRVEFDRGWLWSSPARTCAITDRQSRHVQTGIPPGGCWRIIAGGRLHQTRLTHPPGWMPWKDRHLPLLQQGRRCYRQTGGTAATAPTTRC